MSTFRRFLAGPVVLALILSSGVVRAESPQADAPPATPEVPAPAPATSPPAPEATPAAQAFPAWTEIRLGVHRMLFFSGKLRLTRREETYPGDGPAHGKRLVLVETLSEAMAFGGKVGAVETSSWIDPASGATVEFREFKPRKRLKRLLFRADGYQEQQWRPEDGQEEEPQESWPLTRDRFVPYALKDGTPVPAGQPVRDYYNMVADLGRLDLSGTGAASYYVATKRRVVHFEVKLAESAERTFELTDLASDSRIELDLDLRRVELTPVGEDPDGVGGFLAMEGGSDIWLEQRTGTVAVIGGKMPGLPGRTEILLSGARFDGHGLADALAEVRRPPEHPEPAD